jgi:hypothetical protein
MGVFDVLWSQSSTLFPHTWCFLVYKDIAVATSCLNSENSSTLHPRSQPIFTSRLSNLLQNTSPRHQSAKCHGRVTGSQKQQDVPSEVNEHTKFEKCRYSAYRNCWSYRDALPTMAHHTSPVPLLVCRLLLTPCAKLSQGLHCSTHCSSNLSSMPHCQIPQ